MKKAIPYFADNKLRSAPGGLSAGISRGYLLFHKLLPAEIAVARRWSPDWWSHSLYTSAEFISGLETCLSRNSPLF